MPITWIPEAALPSAKNAEEAGVSGEWLSISKPDSVTAEIQTIHSDTPVSCVVTYSVNPPLPDGLSISVTATGISISGNTSKALQHDEPDIHASAPNDNILVKHTPNPNFKETYVVSITAEWTYLVPPSPTPIVTQYMSTYNIGIYNKWKSDKEEVLAAI